MRFISVLLLVGIGVVLSIFLFSSILNVIYTYRLDPVFLPFPTHVYYKLVGGFVEVYSVYPEDVNLYDYDTIVTTVYTGTFSAQECAVVDSRTCKITVPVSGTDEIRIQFPNGYTTVIKLSATLPYISNVLLPERPEVNITYTITLEACNPEDTVYNVTLTALDDGNVFYESNLSLPNGCTSTSFDWTPSYSGVHTLTFDIGYDVKEYSVEVIERYADVMVTGGSFSKYLYEVIQVIGGNTSRYLYEVVQIIGGNVSTYLYEVVQVVGGGTSEYIYDVVQVTGGGYTVCPSTPCFS